VLCKFGCALSWGVYFLEVFRVEEKELIEKLKDMAPQGRLCCSDARKLAEKLGIEYGVVGKACNELKIKIFACELGCF
jgi:hypothetical protein